MSTGEGVEEQKVPPMLFEIEVEAEPNHDPAETEERGVVIRTLRSSNPLFPKRFPFRTARGFGTWLLSQLAGSPEKFNRLHLQFMRYCTSFRITKLVGFGKRMFSEYNRLCFLQGVFLVAVNIKQKIYVRRVFAKELEKMTRKASEPEA